MQQEMHFCISVEDHFLRADRARKQFSCGVVFLERTHSSFSLTSPVIWNLAFNLEIVLGLKIMLQLGFAEHQIEVALWHGSYSDQSNVA